MRFPSTFIIYRRREVEAQTDTASLWAKAVKCRLSGVESRDVPSAGWQSIRPPLRNQSLPSDVSSIWLAGT